MKKKILLFKIIYIKKENNHVFIMNLYLLYKIILKLIN